MLAKYMVFNKNILILVFILLFAWFSLTFNITEVPPGINGDEASIGYNAILLSQTLHDENGKLLPLFINTLDKRDWKQPITIYTTALMFKVLGTSFAALRSVSVLFVVLSLIFLYFISREYFNIKFFVFSSLAFITTPIIIIQSHLGLENIAPIPFLFFWLWMIIKFEKTKKFRYPLFSGVALGIGIFSYYGMRVVIPILTVLTLVYLKLLFGRNNKQTFKSSIYFLLGVFPFFLILFVSKFFYPGAVVGSFRPSLTSSYEFLFRYLSIYDLSFLFFKGDVTPYHSTGKYGVLLLATLPLFFAGVFSILRTKRPFLVLVLLGFVFSPLLYGFIPELYRGSRLLVLIPFYIIIFAVGFLNLLTIRNKITRNSLAIIGLFLIGINHYSFVTDYWFKYPERVSQDFSTPIHKAFEIVRSKLEPTTNIYIEDGIYKKENTAIKFFKEIYLPNNDLIIWERGIEIKRSALLIVNPDILTLEDKRSLVELSSKFGFYKVYTKK
ncbi:MAG: hypothetical protein US86_C0001G0177 [Candidatus Daviesbacteria bacterium GW2011_GWA2_38_24]|uniref:Glycosyltransferase RgtA/B/C/D-like domain-containing protein n=1 Tax=Candidatus Daviesbacteria bacterium GW2011_GWA2_38_24 TaxID=1618422 RepID=A0A0G0JVW0_9BACT|nr:MAG: hypothetical protein US86_C0001G0177 [Candidatus Daviesbacteria bacterium GW2011_GWA2_38_24]